MFAGRATVTRCLRAGGLKIAALDIEYWDQYLEERERDGKPRPAGNALDILSPSGFLLLDHFIFARASCSSSFMLCACFFAKDSCDVHHAVPPGSLRGDHSHRMLQLGAGSRPHIFEPMGVSWRGLRRKGQPHGFEAHRLQKTCTSNFKLACRLPCRLALLLYLIQARGGAFLVEQPGSSLLFRHPRLVDFCRLVKVLGVHAFVLIAHATVMHHTCMDRCVFGFNKHDA